MNNFGNRLKRLRTDRSISSRQLADRAAIHPKRLHLLQVNEVQPTEKELENLSRALCIPVDQLTSGQDLAQQK